MLRRKLQVVTMTLVICTSSATSPLAAEQTPSKPCTSGLGMYESFREVFYPIGPTSRTWNVLMHSLFTNTVFSEDSLPPELAEPHRPLVADVSVHGNQRIPTSRIHGLLKTRPGSEYNQQTIDEDVRTVFETREFSNVQVKRQVDESQNVVVHFYVTECPPLAEVVFEGNKHLSRERLLEVADLCPGVTVGNFVHLVAARKAICQEYDRQGRFLANVEWRLKKEDGNLCARIVIAEGPVAKVRALEFEMYPVDDGLPTAFDVAELRELFGASPETRDLVGSPFSLGWTEIAVSVLEGFYRSRGFADAHVSYELSCMEESYGARLRFAIDEGPKYSP